MEQKPTQNAEEFKKIMNSLQVQFAEEKRKDRDVEKLFNRKFDLKEFVEKKFSEEVDSGVFLESVTKKVNH